MPRVPTTKDVVPGALVNIVLKADQPTGRTVAGTVATLLTRGNHPRGIKVRLTDGRVGRVQSMAAAVTATAGGGGDEASQMATVPTRASTSRVTASAQELPSQAIGLDAYITKPRRRGGGGKGENHGSNQQPLGGKGEERPARSSEVVACPVCGDFEGDEAAVAHHVSSHFGD
ncbi:hypothetical protein BJX63DRAFT_284184 [Aspergillus granulosus]|uniref:UBZ4-type domain-containing protein n=1 Tax=Aspergillus granulosus TaxID=176169 RepID=A0ABR4HZ54_9EURO